MVIKTYELLISNDEESGLEVNAVAAVDKPAINIGWMAFKEANEFKFSTVDEDQRILIGAAMVPDRKIFRRDEETGEEFNIFFSKQTIAAIAEKFYEKSYHANFNLMHDPEQKKDGVIFFMSFIRDTAKGMVGMAGDYPEGTWFLGAKVNNPEVWGKVKSGELTGFSVEGNFGFKKKPMTSEETMAEIKAILNGIN